MILEKGNILIAEDDPVLREVYVKKFSIAGYQIRTVKDGVEAIEAIEKQVPDLLILDINMPVMDGFTVLEKYPKEQRPFPVIMLTNFGDDRNKQRGEELGAEDYFIKSEMTIRKLMEMVDNLMKAKHYWKK
ncbi:response regulator [Candidatus Peregrinibacteria bacterium CG10_big_fil_rev_8_21_14_0_10_49_24]|nr:MAG: response regulator [Candidatus Peregrinibacteria bacterium CG11_big_fil_rev_8_21_14_0_20_49_14]PIR50649.1 MAG: response regulator [Candidatus Peregrinibacteria bacterium CG10_big_fil_rev_8_21_14_0_10_49_24]PJA67733.1 MAG: response regulator [Candidatus Peregrinibacteria bacterium CG_4_9_14_3_um_filter_49_12]